MKGNRHRPTAGGMLSFAAAARRVDRAPHTLLRWIENGEFPAPVILNKRRYYWPETIENWLDKTYAAAGISVGIDSDGSRPTA